MNLGIYPFKGVWGLFIHSAVVLSTTAWYMRPPPWNSGLRYVHSLSLYIFDKKLCSYFYDIYILKISTFESIADLFDVTMKGRPTYVTLGKTSIRLRLRVSTNTGAQHFLQEFTSVQCTKSYRFNESLFLSLCFYFRENAISTSELNHCVWYLVSTTCVILTPMNFLYRDEASFKVYVFV